MGGWGGHIIFHTTVQPLDLESSAERGGPAAPYDAGRLRFVRDTRISFRSTPQYSYNLSLAHSGSEYHPSHHSSHHHLATNSVRVGSWRSVQHPSATQSLHLGPRVVGCVNPRAGRKIFSLLYQVKQNIY